MTYVNPNATKNVGEDELFMSNLTSSKFTKKKNQIDDQSLLEYLTSEILGLSGEGTKIITITGAPASGKSILREMLIQNLKILGYEADYVSTDDFGKYGRIERNQKIADGAVPLDMKDFALLQRIIDNIKQGAPTRAPVYNETTGDAVVVGEENFPHRIPASLSFFFVEGDFQPLHNPDFKIYLHVPTDIRRENRIRRDLEKRGESDPEKIKKSFDQRLITQYYPYTLPQAGNADVIIATSASAPIKVHKYHNVYSYDIYERSTNELS